VEDKGNNKFLITPDRRKGQLTLLKHVDELTHLQWKDRTTNTVVEDVIVMPHDAHFTRVNTGRTKDRVYMLQYQGGSSRRFFFWMQNASDEKDEEVVTRLNTCMAEPPAEDTSMGGDDSTEGGATGAGGGASDAAPSQQNVEDLLSSMLGPGATSGQFRAPAVGTLNGGAQRRPSPPLWHPSRPRRPRATNSVPTGGAADPGAAGGDRAQSPIALEPGVLDRCPPDGQLQCHRVQFRP
jgi:hypothetical protein